MTRSIWPDCLEQPEQAGAGQAADRAAGDHHHAHFQVDPAAPHMGIDAGHAGAGDLGGRGGDRDGRRNAVEDQQRRGQEAAADAEHARQEARPARPARRSAAH